MTWLKKLIAKLRAWWEANKPEPIPDPVPDPVPDPTPQPEPGEHLRVMWLKDKNASWREMNLTGNKISFDQFKAEMDTLKATGFNATLLFVSNYKDGVAFGGPTNIYTNEFAGAVDPDKHKELVRRLDYAASIGLHVCICLVADDGGYPYTDTAKMCQHATVMLNALAGHYDSVMAWLEPEENCGGYTRFESFVNHVASKTDKPVGVHGTTGKYEWAERIAGCDFIILQGWYKDSPANNVSRVKSIMGKTKKPIYVWEATRGNAKDSHRLNLRAGLVALDPDAKRIKGTP